MYSAEKGYYDIVKELLCKGADVNAKGYQGATALFFASMNGHEDIVKILLQFGADPLIKAENGYSSLMITKLIGNGDIQKILEERIREIKSINKKGIRLDTVLQAQLTLVSIGYDPGPIDGIIGKKTMKAIREFQCNEKLEITGRLDKETLKRLHVGN